MNNQMSRRLTDVVKIVVIILGLMFILFNATTVHAEPDGNGGSQTEETGNQDQTENKDEKKDEQQEEQKEEQKPVAKGQWMQTGANWSYKTPGGLLATGWEEIDGKWYYFNASCIMQTGWVQSGNSWYYMNSDGSMVTGWINDGGWYYLSESGRMMTGWVSDKGVWYYLNSSGVMLTGWQKAGDKWYYLDRSSGAMTTGWGHDGTNWYYFDENGAMKTGWVTEGEKKYLLENSGAMAFNKWASYDGYWYHFDKSGVMQTGSFTDTDGTVYDLGTSGALEDPAAQKAQSYSSATNYLIMVNRTAHMVYIFQGSQGNWSTIKSFSCTDGVSTPNGTFTLGSHTYHFGEEKGYTCWYATEIQGDILFHSVLYVPNSMTQISDGRLGITASHGCIRLDINNAKYIYESLPSGTKIVIYQ